MIQNKKSLKRDKNYCRLFTGKAIKYSIKNEARFNPGLNILIFTNDYGIRTDRPQPCALTSCRLGPMMRL